MLSNASITHYELTYVAMFLIPIAGAPTLRARLPPWLKWTSAVGLCATVFAFVVAAYPFVEVVNTLAYSSKILGATLLSNVFAVAFYKLRQRAKEVLPHGMDSSRAATSPRSLEGLD
ncbi:MAG: hypothetical protein NVSMB3_12980 [Acidobacteriaceae bacterium]